MNKRKVFTIVISALFLVAGVVSLLAIILPPNNPYIDVPGGFHVEYDKDSSFFGDYTVVGTVKNKTNMELNVNVFIEIEGLDGARTKNYSVTLTAKETREFRWFASDGFDFPKITAIRLENHGFNATYRLGGFFDAIGVFCVICFALPVTLALTLLIKSKGRSYDYYSNRLNMVITKLTTSAKVQETNRLQQEKEELEQQLARFRTCEYCGTKNLRDAIKCQSCGANIK